MLASEQDDLSGSPSVAEGFHWSFQEGDVIDRVDFDYQWENVGGNVVPGESALGSHLYDIDL